MKRIFTIVFSVMMTLVLTTDGNAKSGDPTTGYTKPSVSGKSEVRKKKSVTKNTASSSNYISKTPAYTNQKPGYSSKPNVGEQPNFTADPDSGQNSLYNTTNGANGGGYTGGNTNENGGGYTGGNGSGNPPALNLLGLGVDDTVDTSVPNNTAPGTTTPGTQDITNMSIQGTGLTGSNFLAQTSGYAGAQREEAIVQAIQAGNVPDFLRTFVAVPLSWNGHEAVIEVSPDYMAIGTNEDFVRIPMAGPTAQRVADYFGCSIPRPRVVDAIWQNAEYKLTPRPLPPGSDMCSNEYFRRANDLINEELAGRPLGALTAGNKKDIVLTNRLASRPTKVAIYGWHRANGEPIQPLSTVHGAFYADYSHGLRLVSSQMTVDGRETTVEAVLADPELNGLLSSERPVSVTRYPNTD